MKMLNTTGLSFDPWGTLQVTAFQLDFIALITTLWAWRFSQLTIHLTVYSSSSCLFSFSTWILWEAVSKSLSEVKVHNIHCSTLIYQASHFIVEGYQQADQAWLPLSGSIQTTPDDLLVIHVHGNGFQEWLLHHLPRHWGEAVSSLGPPSCLLQDSSNI